VKKFEGGLFQDIVTTVSGRQMPTNKLRGTGSRSIPPAVCRSSGSLIPNGGKVLEMFGFKILNLNIFFFHLYLREFGFILL